uniref:Uncharacterized protein n=1 Tax=Anopheles christyi TaxID=43041 RepID=A0A182KF44_9DIPT
MRLRLVVTMLAIMAACSRWQPEPDPPQHPLSWGTLPHRITITINIRHLTSNHNSHNRNNNNNNNNNNNISNILIIIITTSTISIITILIISSTSTNNNNILRHPPRRVISILRAFFRTFASLSNGQFAFGSVAAFI